MEKNKVVIHLFGRDYPIVSDRPPEEVQRIARYADQKMREIAVATRTTDQTVGALTAMTLTETLFAAQEENQRLRRELWQLGEQLKALENSDRS